MRKYNLILISLLLISAGVFVISKLDLTPPKAPSYPKIVEKIKPEPISEPKLLPKVEKKKKLKLGALQKVLSARSWNYDEFDNGDNSKTAEFHIKWINFLDQDGQWKSISSDFATSTDGTKFEMKTAPFYAEAPLTSVGIAKFINNNKWDIFSKTEISEPTLTQTIQAQGVNNVSGQIVRGDLLVPTGLQRNVSYVLYKNAYPTADLIYYVDFGRAPRLRKLIRFNSKPTIFDYSFNLSYSSPVEFAQMVAGSKRKWREGQENFSFNSDKIISNVIGSSKRGIGMNPFQIWDSSNLKNLRIESIPISIIPNGLNAYTLIKHLPSVFFDTAIFPVYTDVTDTFFPDPSPTTTSVDGFVRRSAACESFANLRGGTGSVARDNVADDESVILDVVNGACSSPNFFQMHRGFFLFDTSAIPDGDTIDSATFSAQECGAGCTTTDNFSQTVDLVLSTTGSNTALAAADFQGTVGNTVLQSDTTFTIPNFGTAYNDFPLNSTGLTNVSKTGITKLGLRFSGDRTNTEPAWANVIAGQGVKYAETAGTGSDPKLAVTHSAAAVSGEDYTIIFDE